MPTVSIDRTFNRASESTGKGRSRGLTGVCVLALAGFACLNLVFWLTAGEDKALSKDLWSGTGSIDLAVDGFKSLRQKPTVVLLGSSLMMYPFWATDKESHPGIADIFHHHLSLSFQDALSHAGFHKPVVYSLAIFGEMASDAYIYVDSLLAGNKRPDYLVFGVAPRDFSDSDLQAPMATLTFKRLVGLANFPRYAWLYLPELKDKVDFLLTHGCFFYARRWRLQKEVEKAFVRLYDLAGWKPALTGRTSAHQAGFMLAGSTEERWSNSLNEYRRRYHDIAGKDLGLQMNFLTRLLQVCQQRDIKVILVNMPLTDLNRALFPNGFYSRFRLSLKALTDRYRMDYLDLGESPIFTHQDYWDTAHLNQFGGHKLIAQLLPMFRSATEVHR